jgi:hypothetical protein
MKHPIFYRINYTDWNFDNWTMAQDPNVFFPTEDNLLQASVIPGASIFQSQFHCGGQ